MIGLLEENDRYRIIFAGKTGYDGMDLEQANQREQSAGGRSLS